MNKTDVVELELKVLKEAIFDRYGYDFRHYSKASFKRRTEYFLSKVACEKVSELVPQIRNNQAIAGPQSIPIGTHGHGRANSDQFDTQFISGFKRRTFLQGFGYNIGSGVRIIQMMGFIAHQGTIGGPKDDRRGGEDYTANPCLMGRFNYVGRAFNSQLLER